ncbi:MAG: pyridoxal-phosphate dependent enzyme [Candidatus Limnocylindrales bacterium]|nr:pyridoxal-phosphate dependent enzyme [Candidatus Limnocylindrales bacterium]
MPTADEIGVAVVCAGCGRAATAAELFPIRCPAVVPGDGIDHVMTTVIDPRATSFPDGDEPNPFVRYRALFRAYHVARGAGWSDERYVTLVERLDRAVAAVDGHGFTVTSFARSRPLSDRLGFEASGGVWVKDETGNVSGSHKARHLMGAMLELLVAEELGATGTRSQPLAIASCGNAALAAAVVARAAGRALDVYVLAGADPVVLERLEQLQARVVVCEREPGVPGDPSVHRLREAIAAGAIPFTCQGNENGLAIEGGETLGFEMVSELARQGRTLDRVVVQVGGGALASSVAQAFAEAHVLGAIGRQPRLDAVQTAGCWPLRRAYDRVAARLRARPDAAWTGEGLTGAALEEALGYAAHHRAEFMWAWESEPQSIAHGILDDETYDWLAVVRGMLTTGGRPVTVDEERLVEANDLARDTTGIDADHTGSSGLAGLMELLRDGTVGAGESVAVFLTGVRRT